MAYKPWVSTRDNRGAITALSACEWSMTVKLPKQRSLMGWQYHMVMTIVALPTELKIH